MASTSSNTSRCSSFASVEAANSVSYGFSVSLFATSEPSPSDAEGSGGGRQPLKCQKAAGSRIEGSAHFSYHNRTTTSRAAVSHGHIDHTQHRSIRFNEHSACGKYVSGIRRTCPPMCPEAGHRHLCHTYVATDITFVLPLTE